MPITTPIPEGPGRSSIPSLSAGNKMLRNVSGSRCVRAADHFHSPVERAVEKQENAICPFDKQKEVNRLHFRPTCSLEFRDCTKDRH
jgi:hypothetical protein